MADNRQIRMAVIGVGAMGQAHCKTIVERVPELCLAAVVDNHEETAAAAGARFHVPYFTRVDDLIRARCTDAVFIVVPHPLHAAVAQACMNAKLHVLCEKPLAETVSAVDRMIACAEENTVTFGVMFQRRFEPTLAAAMEFARSGALGRIIRSLCIIPEFRTQRYYDSNPWRATWRGEGGGVLLNQAPHIIDVFLQITGLPTAVRGHVSTRQHDIEVEDHAEAMLRYADGGTGYFCCSTIEPRHGETIEVVGTTGRLYYHGGALRCSRYTTPVDTCSRTSDDVWGEPPMEDVDLGIIDKPAGQFSVMQNFARHLLFGEPLRCAGASGLASLEFANAITLSSYTNRELTLPIDRAEYDALLQHLRETSTFEKPQCAVERVTQPQFR